MAATDADGGVRIQQSTLVTGGGADKHPWVVKPDCITTVENKQFVKLSKTDTGFMRFVLGSKRTDYSSVGYLKTLGRIRSDATLKLCGSNQGAQLFDEEATLPRRAKSRKRAEAAASIDDSKVVTADMDDIIVDGELQAAACQIQMLPNIDPKACVWLELDAASLMYVRAALLASKTESEGEEKKKDSLPDGVRFRADRKVYLATRMRDGKRTSKTFKINDIDDDDEKAKALNDAKAWVDGESDHGSD